MKRFITSFLKHNKHVKIMHVLYLGIILLIVFAQQTYASTSEYITMSVGQTKTLSLPPSIANLTLKDVVFTSGDPMKLKVLYNTLTTVTVEAVEESSYYIPLKCEFYYYTLQAGKWIYAYHAPFYFMVTIISDGPGPEPNTGEWDANGRCSLTTAEGIPMTFMIINESMKYCAPWGDGLNGGTCIDKNTSGQLTIPSEVAGYRVYNTGSDSFRNCDKITGLILPTSVVSTGSRSFYGCNGITSLDFVENIERLHTGAFMNCLGLVDIIIPNSVKYIDADCFTGCYNIKTVTIGENVQKIENRAFSSSLITSVTCICTIPPTLNKYAFKFPEDIILYVPKGTANVYKYKEGWKDFKEIVEFETSDIQYIVSDKSKKLSIYDLNGRKLSEPSKGLNIIDGKIVLIK